MPDAIAAPAEASAIDPAKASGPGKLFLPVLVGVLLLPAALGSSQTIFNDGDVSWHIATGQWILHHHALPTTDPFSFTWAGKPWVPIEWLAEVIYASAYQLAGYSGVAALVTAVLMALNGIVFFNASRWVRYPLLTLVAMGVVLVPMMLARPHLLGWPILALWLAILLRAREHNRAPPLWAALLMTLWANLHGGFVFGLAIAAAFGLEAVISSPNRASACRQWLLFGVACAVAVCINANGVQGALHPLRFTQLQMLPMIDEWKPSNPKVTPFFFAVLAFTLALIAWKRPRLHPVRWLLLVTFLAAAMFQARHQAMLAIVAAMLLPEGFAKGEERAQDGDRRAAEMIAAAGALFLVAVRALMPLTMQESETNPWKLIASVPPELRSKPVLNDYSMGGPLILSGIRTYIDGRGDMYGDPHVLSYSRIVNGDRREFAAIVNRWNIRWAIVGRNDKRLVAMLDRTPGWRRIRQDKAGFVYVRN
ncbi:MAG TPA: hypothetical protein VNS11_03105 [Sphingomicrobium sp.]|nr:hypothetical protein [Sphingomicrobium sp.]